VRAAKAKEMLSRETLRQMYIQDLLTMGITETKDGKKVSNLTYREAKSQLSIAKILETDIENPENKWF